MWFVYVLECSDGTLYCGATSDVMRRLHEHNHTKRGAAYTRGRRPVKLLGFRTYPNQSKAQSFEHAFKSLDRAGKLKALQMRGWYPEL